MSVQVGQRTPKNNLVWKRQFFWDRAWWTCSW